MTCQLTQVDGIFMVEVNIDYLEVQTKDYMVIWVIVYLKNTSLYPIDLLTGH